MRQLKAFVTSKVLINFMFNRFAFSAARATREKNSKTKKFKRYALIGVAGGVGGVLIGGLLMFSGHLKF